MRLKYNKTSRGNCYYIIRSVYKNGKNTSELYEKLGYPEEIKKKYGCSDPIAWMKAHLAEINEKELQEKTTSILVPFNAAARIELDQAQSYQTGYLFLQKVYYDLKLDLICRSIQRKHSFSYDLNEILSRLVYGRILYPLSKLSTWKQSEDLAEKSTFEYHDVIRALSVLADESDTIQAELYKNSKELIPRETGVLYYDCTNFYFETETEDLIPDKEADELGLPARKYGPSKQHQPSPLVQIGMFMDYNGIPLAIHIGRGNRNEQETLIPLEEQIQRDFELSTFIVCTDAGLSSDANKKYNNWGNRAFITTVSIKKKDSSLREQCLDPKGWRLEGSDSLYDLREIESTEENQEKYYDSIFYKEIFLEDYDVKSDISFDRTLIVTFSIKYKNYQRKIRGNQLARAEKILEQGPKRVERKGQNDARRYIQTESKDADGKTISTEYSINTDAILNDEKYDGFYAVETNLLDDVSTILKVNRGRWEIEESFRILKNDFRSRPVYLSTPKKIKAHFLTCFVSLLIYRILEKQLGSKYSSTQLISTLRSMRMTKASDVGYLPSYTRSEITDALHDNAGFRTDYQIIRHKSMKGVIRASKSRGPKKV